MREAVALAIEPEDRDDLRSEDSLVIRLAAPETLSAISPARLLFMREAVALAIEPEDREVFRLDCGLGSLRQRLCRPSAPLDYYS